MDDPPLEKAREKWTQEVDIDLCFCVMYSFCLYIQVKIRKWDPSSIYPVSFTIPEAEKKKKLGGIDL